MYAPFDLGIEEQQKPGLIHEMLGELLPQFQSRKLPPLPFTTFPVRDAVTAFRHMQQARHRGKVVITVPPPRDSATLVTGHATYLITGGLGALGLETAAWLVSQGAHTLVLTNRSGQADDAAQERIAAWEELGVQTYVRASMRALNQRFNPSCNGSKTNCRRCEESCTQRACCAMRACRSKRGRPFKRSCIQKWRAAGICTS